MVYVHKKQLLTKTEIVVRLLISDIFLYSAAILILSILLVYAGSLVFLLLGVNVSNYIALSGPILAPLLVFFVSRNQGVNAVLIVGSTIISFLILVGSYYISSTFYDQSWDGTAYQLEGIISIAKGWNPLAQVIPASEIFYQTSNTYPKGIWYVVAAIYQVAENIQSGKLLHFILIISGFLLMCSALLRYRSCSPWLAPLLSIAFALNPVSVNQSLSFYVDGQLASTIVCFIALVLLILIDSKRILYILIGAVIIIGINIKLTGIVYMFIYSLSLLLLIRIYNSESNKFSPTIKTICIGYLLAFCVFGYNPYITNAIQHHNPFYPVVGPGSVESIIGEQRPNEFNHKNRFSRLMLSTFSEPVLVIRGNPVLKVPFSVQGIKEINKMARYDVRLGGWGVLFSGALILSFGALVFAWNSKKIEINVGFILLITTIVSVLLNSESWWARFSPQWYFVPLIISMIMFLNLKWWGKVLGMLILVVLLTNSFLVVFAYYPDQYNMTVKLKNYLQYIKSRNQRIYVYFGQFPSNRLNLDREGIKYIEVKSKNYLKCRNPHPIFEYEGLFCLRNERR